MAPNTASPLHLLTIHASYGCARSGVCCTSDWDVPCDPAAHAAIARAIAGGILAAPAGIEAWNHEAPDLPPPDIAVLARRASGACVFLRDATPSACSIHEACGHGILPVTCRQFPRVALADDRGLHVTLSHYCPTAARLLLASPAAPLAILRDPPGWHAGALEPGLDARGHWPPLARPGVMLSFGAWSAWERFCVATWACEGVTASTGLAAMAAAAARLRGIHADSGALEAAVARLDALREPAVEAGSATLDAGRALADWRAAWATVPPGRATPPVAPSRDDIDDAIPRLEGERDAVARYLASKCVANWMAYQGHGLLAFVSSVRAAAHLVLVEAARGREREPADRVREAVRRADLLLMHLADAAVLAARWNRRER